MDQPMIKISVRSLVEFILREGDIDNRTAGSDRDAMQLGAKIHRKIQRRMGPEYQAEVTLKHVLKCRDFDLQIEGRADGIIRTDLKVVIDEIKGVFKEVNLLKKPENVHLAQAKCYAYIYAKHNDLDQIGVQMTYCNIETEDIRHFHEEYEFGELENWFLDLAGKYEKWARYQLCWKEEKNGSIKDVEFPFPYRKGQRNLVTSVYKTILRKKTLFIQAPTGVGKTMATVFPAVKAVGEGLGDRIFYLTAKTITRTAAQHAFHLLKEQGLKLKVITLTAKEKSCFCDEANCNPDNCRYAKGHYDRVNDAVYELITTADDLDRDVLARQAEKWTVCPFEMSLDVSIWADAVICDYNYVFDPNASLKRFFAEGMKGEYIFLVDEAHNLVDRGRQMYSASICKEEFLRIKRLVKSDDPKLARHLEDCNKSLLAMKRECDGYVILDSVSHIYLKLMNLMTEMERFLEECKNEEMNKGVLELYFDVRMFLNIHDRLDENYIIYSELDGEGKFMVRLFCVDPSRNLTECLDKGNSTIFFSATLLPIHYYKKLLSTGKEDYAIYAKSPFDPGHRLILMGVDASTRYTRRGKDMYQKYAHYLIQMARSRKGNYIAFFPSYSFMEEVYEEFAAMEEEERHMGAQRVEYVMQSRYMSEEAREIFLENYEEDRDVSLMGFCVMGGVFSEGIDLSEDRLIGAAIAGTGLPQVCREREILKQYFDEKGLRGFDYAYLYPGMNKVLQSAGRVIRTEEDRGVILLLDDRFQDNRYKETFPREWEHYELCNDGNVIERISRFWAQQWNP